MDLRKTYITRLLLAIPLLLASMLFIACFDIPSEPKKQNSLNSVSIQIKQNGIVDSVLLKIHPMDTAVLSAQVDPKKYEKNLSFSWYHCFEDSTKDLLNKGQSFTIPPRTQDLKIPNLLQITDEEGNSIIYKFNIVINTPPQLNKGTSPANGETLYGNSATSFLFSWSSIDKDNEKLAHAIIIDSVRYEVGELTRVYQSGFAEGKHTFQVFVFDQYGDADSSNVINFYVKNQEKE